MERFLCRWRCDRKVRKWNVNRCVIEIEKDIYMLVGGKSEMFFFVFSTRQIFIEALCLDSRCVDTHVKRRLYMRNKGMRKEMNYSCQHWKELTSSCHVCASRQKLISLKMLVICFMNWIKDSFSILLKFSARMKVCSLFRWEKIIVTERWLWLACWAWRCVCSSVSVKSYEFIFLRVQHPANPR